MWSIDMAGSRRVFRPGGYRLLGPRHFATLAGSGPLKGSLAECTLCYTIRPALQRRRQSNEKVGASVARCPRTPPDAAKTSGLQIGLSNRLRGLSNRSIVVVGNYCSGPITVEPCRAKARPLHPRRSCFAPISGIGSQVSIIRRLLCGSLTRYPDY